ncbi:MAG: VOC family protein [Catenulisporales bacterium]|nr:VOC family protein [Catenulisporales bacterium]
MKQSEYTPGTPCWVDLATSDMEGAKEFYGGLFDWTAETSDVPEAGGYTQFLLDGTPAAGLMALMSPEQPVAWSSYVSVTDADATAAKVNAAGGKVIMPPMDVTDVGRMAYFFDPTGAALGVWQPRAFAGAGVVNEPGALCWTELATRDAAAAKKFYTSVFGWGVKTNPMGEGQEYTEWLVGDQTVGGMIEMDDEHFGADMPPHWGVYFAVADCAASVAKVGVLGGSVTVPPTEIPVGTFAVCRDPQGGFFSLIQLAETMPESAGSAA